MHAADLLSQRAALSADREALVELETGRRLTYAELNRRANRTANFLAEALGIGKGDRVAVLAHNCLAFVELFYATTKLGAVLTPLNWRLSVPELAYVIGDSLPSVLCFGPELAETATELRAQTEVPEWVGLEGARSGDALDYEEETARAADREPPRPALDAADPLCLIYTSGTTGRPKGALIPHRQVVWNAISTAASWGLTANDVSPVFTPLFHVGGLFVFLTPLHYLGGRVVLARTASGGSDLRVVERERCTVILGVPTLYQIWRDAEEYRRADLSSVRFFISGGAPCPTSLLAAWREDKGVVMRQGYGLTEVGPNCFSMTDAESVSKAGSIGRPSLFLEARLAAADGSDAPVGSAGELCLRGPQVCTGYWNNSVATESALRDGWFHTGDMARMDEAGCFRIAGRQKEMIISGGENVYAAEVEAVFTDHPAVAEAALIGQPDETWGEVGVMVVIPRPGHATEANDLLAFCKPRLARYKIPKRVVFAEDFPRTALGKPQKEALARMYAR